MEFGEYDLQFIKLRAQRLIRRAGTQAVPLFDDTERPDPEVTAVIPTRNEEQTIAMVVEECRRYAGTVLVVDGRSTDATVEHARQAGALVCYDDGRGKGSALSIAVAEVKTPICVFIDADGSHDPIDIPLLVAPIKKGLADQVIGSRLLGGSDELHGGGDEFLRLTGSTFITYMINLRFGARLSDSQNGFRAIRTTVYKAIAPRSRHTTIEMELLMKALALGYKVEEVPTHELARVAGYSKISLARPATWFSYGWCLVSGLCTKRRSQA